mgnify:CR=1 FL=1
MRIDILTLFPASVDAMMNVSILGRAQERGYITIKTHQIRDYTTNKQMQVDDYPYGGGWGCVMMAQPLKSCLDNIMSTAKGRKSRVIYMSPQGKPYDQGNDSYCNTPGSGVVHRLIYFLIHRGISFPK